MSLAMLDDEEAQRFGKFVLVRRFRKGGMGALALAIDTQSGRQLVIKRLLQSSSEDDRAARFRDEVKLSFTLSHPNLAHAIESGTIDGTPYLALEWIAGQDLDALLERSNRLGQRLPPAVAASIIRQMCSAFEYAHAQAGFVHRDVSPNNIMLGYDGIARLIDYGAALSQWKTSKTIPGMVLGTVGYLSPEQRQGQPADARSDLFSLGAIFWFLLTGLPYFGEGEDGDSKAILHDRFKVQGGESSEPLLTFLWRALQRDPNQRHESAAEMGAELERALPPAVPAEVSRLLGELFAVEQKIAAEETDEWQKRYAPTRSAMVAERTAVVIVRDRDPGLLKRRAPLLALVFGAATGAVGAWATLGKSRPKPRPPELLAPVSARPSALPPPGEPRLPRPSEILPAARPPRREVLPRGPTPVESHGPPLGPLLRRVQEARTMAERGQVRRAREVLAELGKDARLRLPVQIALADVEYGEGHFNESIALASRAIRGGAGVEALATRAAAELKSGKVREALHDFNRVLAVRPHDEDAREGKKTAQQLLLREETR